MRPATARLRVRVGPEPTDLERLAVVFADPIRLKIITELFARAMSASGFHAAYGGGSVGQVDKHFKKLQKYGWLRHVDQATGGRRRGSTEHFYRAPKLAVFDEDTFADLPDSVKEEFSWRIFEQFAERVNEAFEAGTFDARKDRHFTWTPLVLDELGRARVLERVNLLFESLFEEQEDSTLRLRRSGETPIRTTVGLAAFDSPNRQRNRSGLLLPPPRPDDGPAQAPFTTRVAKVFANSLSLKIMTELNLREMSPSQFAEEFEADRQDVYARFRSLAAEGWLVKVREKTGGKRRGATEKFFRATGPAIFDSRSWSEAPDATRTSSSWRIFEQLAEQVREAMVARTFDSRADRHHTWSALELDQRGWDQLIKAIDGLFYSLEPEQEAARRRLLESGDEAVIATVYLAAFESPSPRPPTR